MILILSKQNDPHCDLIAKDLKSKNASFLRLNSEDLFENCTLSTDAVETTIIKRLSHLDISQVTTIYARGFDLETVKFYPDADINGFFINETRALIFGVLLDHQGWFNHPFKSEFAAHKLIQIKRARSLGLAVPETIVTNCPETLRRFIMKHSPILNKVLNQGRIGTEEGVKLSYAKIVNESDLVDNRIKALPSIYQSYIEKSHDIRVTLVNGRTISVAIFSQEKGETVDWRKERVSSIRHEEVYLPKEIEQKCVNLVKSFGLNYGAIDLVVDKKGQYYFLELNPEGLWAWQEIMCNVNITHELTDALINFNPT